MKKFAFFLAMLVHFCCAAFAANPLKDVPKDNYARPYLEDLMYRGIDVSQGYPDGTFRGDKLTDKYDICYLWDALYLKLKRNGTAEVDVSDIRDEITWLRGEIKSIKEAPEGPNDFRFTGNLTAKSAFGSIVAYEQNNRAELGPETDYRLIYTIEKSLGTDAHLKMNLDTMDGAFNSSSMRDLPTKLIDIQGDITANIGLDNPAKIKATVGPGSVAHRDTSGVMPSDDYTYFARPRPTFSISTIMGDFDVGAGYAARGVAYNGRVGTSEFNFNLGRQLGALPIVGTSELNWTSRYVFVDFMDPTTGPNNYHQEFSLLFRQSDDVSGKLMVGVSAPPDNPKAQYFFNYEMTVRHFLADSNDLKFYFDSVGSDYRLPFEALEFVPYNIFNKKILDGTIDIGIDMSNRLSEQTTFRSMTDWVGDDKWRMDKRTAGASLTQQFQLDQSLTSVMTLSVFYRYYYVPSKVGQFSVVVPEYSDVLALGLMYRF